MSDSAPIAAISSAVGPAARMIVRASGDGAIRLSNDLTRSILTPGSHQRSLHFAGLSVPAWLYVFAGPRSYTGEDLVEFHIPGNPLLARMLLQHLTSNGARLAEAGEFTARAYFNGRMDLTEAEGVAATIGAHSEAELRAARRLLSGELAKRLRPAMEVVAETLALVEVGIDFAGEDVTFLSAMDVSRRIEEADRSLETLVAQSARFERLSHEPLFVLVGRPNAGKSTLLNALAGRARAVVSSIEGTTRDVLSADVLLDRGIVKVLDVAGLEASLPDVDDRSSRSQIAGQMHTRALRSVETADFIIQVKDVTDSRAALDLSRRPDLFIVSKCDLANPDPSGDEIHVSAADGTGLDALKQRMSAVAFGADRSEGLALNARHLDAIADARAALDRARIAVDTGREEIVAFDLRESLDALGRVLGAVSTDDLLGKIFSAFCIGK